MDNIDVDFMIEDVKSFDCSEMYSELVTLLILELIKAYDETNSEKFKNASLDLVNWLIEKDPNKKINRINKYQITRRLRDFHHNEIEDLISMKQDATPKILCGISILLENKSDVDFYFRKLSKEDKEEFLKYPIYFLADKLKLV
jgi:hypothetical protein